MSYTATLTKTGQITVPKGIRETLELKPGQRVVFHKRKKMVAIEKEKSFEEITNEIHALVPKRVRENYVKNSGDKTAGELREAWIKNPVTKARYAEAGEADA